MSVQPLYITAYNSGLVQNKKPFLIPDQAFQTLQNAYVWRDRLKKREGLRFLGRLRRVLTLQAMGNISSGAAGTFQFDLLTAMSLEANAEFEPGNLTNISIAIGAPINQTLTDTTGTGLLTIAPAGVITSASLDYATMVLTLTFSGAVGASAATFTGAYYPSLPVMGIAEYEIANINLEDTIYFDTKYAYIWNGTNFTVFGAGTTWTGTDSDFFWTTNWRGTNPYDRLFFATNFTTGDPIRYYNGAWNSFAPAVDAVNVMGQARILVPYYGRLVALNVYEGVAPGVTNNYFNRCRFSQVGDPLQADAWRSDQFGKGGFIDAPVNEEITSAIFFKNTLIVFFEETSWQLRYVGEYGLPFVWERISSDFGCESTFSTILFDDGVLAVGDKAIIQSNSVTCQRIDQDIPDQVFSMNNANNGPKRVHGVRDFYKELVTWTYSSSQSDDHYFPDQQLVFNYKNNTWAKFRGNITAFGTQREITGVTWNRDDIFWSDDTVFWDNTDDVVGFPQVVCGNQQGFVHSYMDTSMDEQSLSITSVDLTTTPIRIVVKNHNLYNGEIIYITGMLFLNATQTATLTTTLNNNFYSVQRIDSDTLDLYKWDVSSGIYISNFTFTPVTTAVYTGGGRLALIPRMFAQTKDFNPFQAQGKQIFLSYIDLLTDASPNAKVTLELYVSTSRDFVSNATVGNKNNETSLTMSGSLTGVSLTNPCVITAPNHSLLTGDEITIYDVVGTTELNGNFYTVTSLTENTFSLDGIDATGFTAYVQGGVWQQTNYRYYVPGQQYCWHRFYATSTGQFINIALTYGDDLMNQRQNHQSEFVMNAMVPYVRGASRNVF